MKGLVIPNGNTPIRFTPKQLEQFKYIVSEPTFTPLEIGTPLTEEGLRAAREEYPDEIQDGDVTAFTIEKFKKHILYKIKKHPRISSAEIKWVLFSTINEVNNLDFEVGRGY